MAIAVDSTSGGEVTLGTTLSVSHTCAGSNLVLVVATECNGVFLQNLTYDGVSMSKITEEDAPSGTEMWYLVNPSTGTNDIVATLASSGYIKICAASYTGASQTGVPDNDGKVAYPGSNGTTQSISITPVADECWVIGCAFVNALLDTTAGAGTTIRNSQKNPSGGLGLGDSNGPISPAASHTLNFVCIAPAGRAALAMSLAPASIQVDSKYLSLLGVGT